MLGCNAVVFKPRNLDYLNDSSLNKSRGIMLNVIIILKTSSKNLYLYIENNNNKKYFIWYDWYTYKVKFITSIIIKYQSLRALF